MSEYWAHPPFGPANTRQSLDITWQVTEKRSSAGWAAKNISAARYTYRLRVWDSAGVYVKDALVTKSVTEDADGWLDHAEPLGDTAYPTLSWRISEIDADVQQSGTKSGQRERTIIQWKQPIEETPAP